MSGRVYWPDEWRQARERRAASGRAPRLAVRRSILLRQAPEGEWVAAIYEWRFGKWKQPTWLCGRTALPQARRAALAAWEEHRLPLLWAYADEVGVRPFYPGLSEPGGGAHERP